MKYATLILSALVSFVLFAFGGFLMAARAETQARLPVSPKTALLREQQTNIVLIQVDDLQAQQPQLRSVWMALRFHSENQTVLTFVRLYPNSDDPQRGQELKDSFGLTNTDAPAPVFLRKATGDNRSTSGYLMTDDAGLEQVTAWVRQTALKANTSGDSQILQASCSALLNAQTVPLPSFDYQAFAAHLNTNLAYDQLLAEWQQLTQADPPLRCEMVSR